MAIHCCTIWVGMIPTRLVACAQVKVTGKAGQASRRLGAQKVNLTNDARDTSARKLGRGAAQAENQLPLKAHKAWSSGRSERGWITLLALLAANKVVLYRRSLFSFLLRQVRRALAVSGLLAAPSGALELSAHRQGASRHPRQLDKL